jgi:catechol 2,3-dioxygenase-like lactoylglutathione lyase family enzyme
MNFKPLALSHVNVTMPEGADDIARAFYGGVLGLKEIPKPEGMHPRRGVWFDAGGLDVHVSVDDQRLGPDRRRHFGFGCEDVDGMRAHLTAAGIATEDRGNAPWKRFYFYDPFGNCIEIHEPNFLRG